MTDQTALPPLRVLVLDDEATIRTTLSLCLETAGHRVSAFSTSREAIDACARQVYDLLFLDLRLGTENGLDFIPEFFRLSPWIKIIVITAYASIDTAVEAMRRGAMDYLPKPFTPEHVETLAAKVAERRAMELRLRELAETVEATTPQIVFATENRQVRTAWDLARTFASAKSVVLLAGEDGTGKRTLARAVHEWSPRRGGPFAAMTVQGRNEAEVAAELFGGADGSARSRLEHCSGGTLYIDEAAALSPRLQLKLLEFAQTGRFEREENFEQVQADVRVLAGSSKPLAALAEAGLLRRDLYYTLSAKMIELPPLRERMEDFQTLTDAFLACYARQMSRPCSSFTAEAMEYLRAYSWPGNLRELRNVVDRAVLLAKSGGVDARISIEHLPANLRSQDAPARLGDLVPLETIEELHIRGVLATTQSLESAAKILGIDYATLWRRRKKYGL